MEEEEASSITPQHLTRVLTLLLTSGGRCGATSSHRQRKQEEVSRLL
ncbi:hypothetical protein E2C01_092926 [Portunus trituberculatus]|uniref:Uncharacterized protein n=1 Tax=Portunus trituberculatus TaxID=210409 RepID=A0A5B7JTJ0_PORTR|nr:hypothetical protein [Portunus trituberculatus]